MAIEATVKKWGNSFGIVLPKDFVQRTGLREDDIIAVQVVKKADISHLFGTKKPRMKGQEFKDMVRMGWS